MKKVFLLLLLTVFACKEVPRSETAISVIPYPLKVIEKEGAFLLNADTKIISTQETLDEANYLAAIFENAFGKKALIENTGNEGIILKIDSSLRAKTGAEGYVLHVSPKNITVKAAAPAGVFYGIQTLRQLFPPEFEYKRNPEKSAEIKALEIFDKPRFPWRAFMLDEARYFKGVNSVKLLLEQMALNKMNVFHWHLVDDQGWRIEIKKYPKLTEIGSKRKNSMLDHWDSNVFSGIPHQGFYTQEEIRDIIRYAEDRHITVVPEIEMPGHSGAAIASYPWLGTSGITKEVPYEFGCDADIYNVADPKVEQFIKDVLVEVIDLFPSNVIHIGGDEVDFELWKKSESVSAFMKKNGLDTPADLQISFTNKISNFIESHGRRMMGWNDILGGASIHDYQSAEDVKTSQNLAQNTIVHFWKGDLELIKKAVSSGYDVVNSYHKGTYLDYTYKRIPLKTAYDFDPIPEGLDEKYDHKILGLGCQMWGEWIPTEDRMEYQVFPRLSAYAETGWTDNSLKNYKNFVQRLNSMKKRWEIIGINFANRP